MEHKINPYPGLRPFTEKESIFFKGRDLHIRQIIKQLQENKIIVITGASGDGKSSLVYAGVIPNARAGFFRAEYNNWLICDFRPERSPLFNLAQTLSEHLEQPFDELHEELQLGFSSLTRIYKKSGFYVDKTSDEWKMASDNEKQKMKSKGANLFILADQFEEFFTNPENYAGGVPSDEAYIAVNLLLETAGLAITENLPIYIVFTMRSDFISQSVSFKGLPEYIGYSQFFVPRLQRNELQQVIEEPARLAGGSVSKRLSETLINELRDGFDQLPIIQYTLSQLWKVADNGNDEIDLVHLVKLAGLPTKFLSAQDKEKFNTWVEQQEDFKEKHYTNTSLSNVLNTHANILYETAQFYYQEMVDWAKAKISEEDARMIVKTSFLSLTKIDMGRAVRNRVTLKEITHIINREDIEYETVCGVLNVFRLPGNNFIRPYINKDDIDTEYLSADTVLDITHEALIRNWEILSYWEVEEKENYNNYQDFAIQLERWKNNNKSKEFLLSLGPLVHFEKWYDINRPNKYWIAKYDDTLDPKEVKIQRGDELVDDIKEYLGESRKAITEAERAKRRRRALVTALSVVIMMVLGGFTYWALEERKEAFEQKKIAEEQTRIAIEQSDLAKKEKNRALTATERAELERQRAEKSALEAIWAKNQSEKAREYAVFQRLLAEEQKVIAETETDKAKREKERADREKEIAEQAKLIAEQATDSANTLNYLTLARTLALKAQNTYEDPHINLLLALQAYKYNHRYGGYERHPDIYHAFRHALTAYGKSNILDVTNERLISFYVLDRFMLIHTRNNELLEYNVKTRKIENKKSLFKSKIPVNTSYFFGDEYLVIGFEDRTQVIAFLHTGKKYKLNGHEGLIRAADKNPLKDEFATGGRDRKIMIWKLEGSNQKPLKVFTASSRINSLRYTADGKNIIAAENNGTISVWNVETGKQQILERREGIRALSIGQNRKRNIMAVGFDNGSVLLFYPNKKYSKKDYLLSRAGIKSIDFSSTDSLMTISKENKKIDIRNFPNVNAHSIKIMDHDVRVTNLIFARSDRLYGLCEDNTIRYWEKSNLVYSNIVKSLIKRNFTEAEWKQYVGSNVKYEKTFGK